MPVTTGAVVARNTRLASAVGTTITALEATEARVRRDLEAVQARLAQSSLALAGAYLPELEPAIVARASRLTGFRTFTQRDPFKAMAHESQRLGKSVARVQADPDYQRREALVGPYGALTRKLAEAREMLGPWEEECRRYQELPGWTELLDTGYDTPAFAVPFYDAYYWRLWAWGDAACEALGVGDFGDDVLPAWRKVEGERSRWRGEVAAAQKKVEAVHELVREHDQALALLPRLPEVTLAQCRSSLAEWLRRADVGLLDEWLRKEGEDRAVQMALRELAGLRAKEEFLQEIVAKGVKPIVTDLRARQTKLHQKVGKYNRPKWHGVMVPDAELNPGFEDKLARLAAENDRLHKQVDRMVAYDRYDRFDLSNDSALWWLEFTGGRPGRFSPGLRDWYTRHPDVRQRLDEAPSVAVVTPDEESTGGYLS